MQARMNMEPYRNWPTAVPPAITTNSSILSDGATSITGGDEDRSADFEDQLVKQTDAECATVGNGSGGMSAFETVFTNYPPILESLLLNLSTPSILNLYHTSRHLRQFISSYPLAWANMSFRTLPPQPSFLQPNSGTESPDGNGQNKKAHAMDLLCRFLIPKDAILTRLDLDNTSVSGAALHSRILEPKRATLAHLSVRGCKEVSLKYHILPFLYEEKATPLDLLGNRSLALKSLYVYRCRHHRRRPYFPASLNRKDPDSKPTHELVELCHDLDIWTDTAWCPTPGLRCFRRRDYYSSRSEVSPPEVWVPFDKLWRSQNFVGSSSIGYPPGVVSQTCQQDRERAFGPSRGRLWEEDEFGHLGEALGARGYVRGEGKSVPTHLRKSHTTFADGHTCHSCGEAILERCEQCSVRMHCMGCRKSLCASCAFDRPLPKRRRIVDETTDEPRSRNRRRGDKQMHRYWWAPGARRSPNLMNENSLVGEDASSDEEEDAQNDPAHPPGPMPTRQPKLDMSWCCLEPGFSGGGGIAFVGSHCGDHIRTSPLPQKPSYQGPAFRRVQERLDEDDNGLDINRTASEGSRTRGGGRTDFDVFPYLEQDTNPESAAFQRWTSPRSLCKTCYESNEWKIPCTACRTPICIDHDIKTLKARRCGFRKLTVERELIQDRKKALRDRKEIRKEQMSREKNVFYAKWRPIISRMLENRTVQNLGHPRECVSPASVAACPSPAHGLNGMVDTSGSQVQQSFPQPHLSSSSQMFGHSSLPAPRQRSRSFSAHTFGSTEERLDEAPAPDCRIVDSAPMDLMGDTASDVPEATTSDSSSFIHSSSPASSSGSSATVTPLAIRSRPLSSAVEDSALPSSWTARQTRTSRNWTGCYSYFCPAPRDPNDRRHACSFTALQTCQSCGIMVCAPCSSAHPQCPCTVCSAYFLCPKCSVSPPVRDRCRYAVEEAERIKREKDEHMKAQIARAAVREQWDATEGERERANDLAQGLGEFLDALNDV